MSSSTGVTIGPMEALQLVPPQIMRYLIARNQPKRHIEFDTGAALIELADEYQKIMKDVYSPFDEGNLSRRQQVARKKHVAQIMYSQVRSSGPGMVDTPESYLGRMDRDGREIGPVTFRHLAMLSQIRSDDENVWSSLRRSGHIEDGPSDDLRNRLKLMRNWTSSTHFPDGFRLEIQSGIGEQAKAHIDIRDVGYLVSLWDRLAECDWTGQEINSIICDEAKQREISLRDAFQTLYWIVLNQDFGPKLANILAEMDRQAVQDLLQLAIDELSS
jgi:lysyl-tRNA synthetase class 1